MSKNSGTVLLRVDFNSPTKNGEITDFTRIQNHTETIETVSKSYQKVVLMTHQGRKGRDDFVSTSKHADKLSKLIDNSVEHLESINPDSLKKDIEDSESTVILIENTRFFSDETKDYETSEEASRCTFVEKLSETSDLYINDAFSVGHRKHASVIGFPELLESYYGPLFQSEVLSLDNSADESTVYCIGGSKVTDKAKYSEKLLRNNRAGKILTTGLLANLILYSTREIEPSVETPEVFDRIDTEYFENNLGDRVHIPSDYATESDGKRHEINKDSTGGDELLDIGSRTIKSYKDILKNSSSVVMIGPSGLYEDERFRDGTCELLRVVSEHKNGKIAGGDTISASNTCTVSDFEFVSTGGGAALVFLATGTLPAMESIGEVSEKNSIL